MMKKKPLKFSILLLLILIVYYSQLSAISFEDVKKDLLTISPQPLIKTKANNNGEPLQPLSPIYSNDTFPVIFRRPAIYSAAEIRNVVNTRATLILVNTTKPFFICMPPKTGCTRMKGLVSFANGGPNYFTDMESKPHRVHFENPFIVQFMLPRLSPTNKLIHLQTSPRVLITRNPYVRFLSGYFDFCRRNKRKIRKKNQSHGISFEEYVSMVENEAFEDYNVYHDHHLKSISYISDYSKVRYSTILRLEEQDLWYQSLVKNFGLESAIDRLKKEKIDFYSPNTFENSTILEKTMQITRISSWKGQSGKDKHDNDSEHKIFEFYTPTLARRVFDLHREDFEHFAYPAWDGDPSSFRIL